MSLLVVGSLAFDSVETPTSRRDDVMGGSASYFSYAASYFTSVRLVAPVGEDWPDEFTKLLETRRIDTSGLQVISDGKTFRWTGRYQPNMNDRDTLDVQLNVLAGFDPVLSEEHRRCPFVFLANGSPTIHMKVLDQIEGSHFVVADTMDFYINTEREALLELLKRINGLVLNDSEAKLLTGEENIVKAGREICFMGPKFVVIKKGEHGALFFTKNEIYVLPAYPTETVVDPTGAGDSFAGGMMGYLAEQGDFDSATLKKALAYGTVVASFNVEDFSLDRMQAIEREDIEKRMEVYRHMLTF